MVERTRPIEVRLSGRTLRGVALRYGEQARDRAEMFEPGAFQPIGPVSLNLQHDRFREVATTDGGSLRITDTPTELQVEADLREGSAELSLVRRRALRGSVRRVSGTGREAEPRRSPGGTAGGASRYRIGRFRQLPDGHRTTRSLRRSVADRRNRLRPVDSNANAKAPPPPTCGSSPGRSPT